LKVEFGGIVTGARGRFSGSVFSANAGGAYVKPFRQPVARRDPKQEQARNVFGSWGLQWRNLTNVQRTAWNNWAALPAQTRTDSLGQSYNPNGFNYFVQLNTNLLTRGLPPISNAPVLARPTAPTLALLTITSPGTTGNSIVWDPLTFGVNDAICQLNFTRSRANRSPIDRNFLFQLAVPNASIVNIQDLGDITGLFGTVQTDSFWTIRAYAQNAEGYRSTFSQISRAAF
jgi:hypothetical protein